MKLYIILDLKVIVINNTKGSYLDPLIFSRKTDINDLEF